MQFCKPLTGEWCNYCRVFLRAISLYAHITKIVGNYSILENYYKEVHSKLQQVYNRFLTIGKNNEQT